METIGKQVARVMREVTCQENKRVILEFINFLEGEGYSTHYQNGFVKTLILLDRHLRKPFKDASESELMGFLRKYRNQPHTRSTYATRIKAFYRWLFTGRWRRGNYPKVVENISTTVRKHELPIKSPNDILTQDEVLMMIDAADNPRDKAMIALLYDSAARPSEILNLKIKDVKLNKTHGEVFVTGKTGMRRVVIVFSIPYLMKWLNAHPRKDDPEAKLFPKLKQGRGGEDLTPNGLDALVKRLARRVGIEKRITAYLFRHSRLTELANVLRDSQLKALAGWTASSRMAEHYIRLAGLDLLARHRIREGMPLCIEVMDIDKWGKRDRISRCLKALATYGSAAKKVLPQLRQLEKDLLAHKEAQALQPQIDQLQSLMKEIENATETVELRSIGDL